MYKLEVSGSAAPGLPVSLRPQRIRFVSDNMQDCESQKLSRVATIVIDAPADRAIAVRSSASVWVSLRGRAEVPPPRPPPAPPRGARGWGQGGGQRGQGVPFRAVEQPHTGRHAAYLPRYGPRYADQQGARSALGLYAEGSPSHQAQTVACCYSAPYETGRGRGTNAITRYLRLLAVPAPLTLTEIDWHRPSDTVGVGAGLLAVPAPLTLTEIVWHGPSAAGGIGARTP